MLSRLPLLRSICPGCQASTLFSEFSRNASQQGSISAADHGSKNHSPANRPKQQRSKKSSFRHADPIRPVADKLLKSLMKRHKDKFAVPVEKNKPPSPVHLITLSTQDLIHTLHTLPIDTSSRPELLKITETLLIKRLYHMSLESALQACHGFYKQEHSFYQFVSQMLSVVDEQFENFSPSMFDMTQLLLYIFIHGSAPSMLLHRVEEYMLENLDSFDINDLGVICVGFFRGNSRLSSQDLLDAIADKLLTDLDHLEPFLLLDFMKMFRHASYIKVSFYEKLADYLVTSNWVSRYKSINPVMHIAFTYASIPICHSRLFESLLTRIETLVRQQRSIRTKDISKFIWACGALQFKPDNCEARYSQLIQVFDANSRDTHDFPESVAELLMGLAYLAIFPAQLLNRCLSPDIVAKLVETGNDREKSMQLLLLNETMRIECPEYRGNLISQSQLKTLLRHPSVCHGDVETELQTRVGLLAAVSCLQQCLGTHLVRCHHAFRHFRTTVIEVQHCEQHGFVSVSPPTSEVQTCAADWKSSFTQRSITEDVYSGLTAGSGQEPTVTTVKRSKRVAVLVSSSSQYALNDSQHALGHLSTMKRQLEKVGYIVVEIHPEEALKLELSSHEETCRHLSAVLSKALQTRISLS